MKEDEDIWKEVEEMLNDDEKKGMGNILIEV